MGSLIQKEDRAQGSVKTKVYLTYLRAWGLHWRMPLLFVGIACTERGCQVRSFDIAKHHSVCLHIAVQLGCKRCFVCKQSLS